MKKSAFLVLLASLLGWMLPAQTDFLSVCRDGTAGQVAQAIAEGADARATDANGKSAWDLIQTNGFLTNTPARRALQDATGR